MEQFGLENNYEWHENFKANGMDCFQWKIVIFFFNARKFRYFSIFNSESPNHKRWSWNWVYCKLFDCSLLLKGTNVDLVYLEMFNIKNKCMLNIEYYVCKMNQQLMDYDMKLWEILLQIWRLKCFFHQKWTEENECILCFQVVFAHLLSSEDLKSW